MDFSKIIKSAEQEEERSDVFYFNVVFDTLTERIKEAQKKDKNITIKDIISEEKEYVNNFLKTHNHFSFKTKTIEYYLYKRMYSSLKYNLNNAYRDVYDYLEKEKIDSRKQADKKIVYSYNLDDDMRKLTMYFLCNIRKEKAKISKYLIENPELDSYVCSRKKSTEIRKIAKGDTKVANAYQKVISFYNRDELEILQDKFKEYTGNSAKSLKKDLIESIKMYTDFLDRYGIIEKSVEANNAINRNIYLKDCDYTYEEIKEQLTEESLKKYPMEQLLGMSLQFGNRSAKCLKEINKCTYVLSHPELYETYKQDDGSLDIKISDENVRAVGLKMNILQKVFIELYGDAEKILDENEKSINEPIDIEYETESICNKYDKEYKNYLDKILVYSNNHLRKDIDEVKEIENAIYNSYKIKGQKMQAILIPILNKETDYIENYGVIDDTYRKMKNFKLMGIDIFGMSDSLRLHEPDDILKEPLKCFNIKVEDFQKYRGGMDFTYATGNNIPTQVYVPMSKEKCQNLKKNEQLVKDKDKYGKVIKHKNYIANKGKMPEHMKNEER